MRMLNNSISQQTALVKTDISWRRTNQTADRVAFHILGHIKTQQFNAEGFGELHRDFGLTDTSWSGKQERTDRLMLMSQTGTAHFDRFSQRLNGFILSEYQHFQTVAQVFQRVAIALRYALLRDPRNAGHYGLNIRHVDGFLALADRHQTRTCARFINHVNRFIRQMTIVNVFHRQFDRCTHSFGGIADVMVRFVFRLQTIDYLHGLFYRWLSDIDFLETAR